MEDEELNLNGDFENQEKADREVDDYLLNIIMQNENSTSSKTTDV